MHVTVSERTKPSTTSAPAPPPTPVAKAVIGDPEAGEEFVRRLSQLNQMEQVCHINYLAKRTIEQLCEVKVPKYRVYGVVMACISICETPEPCPALTRLFLQSSMEKLIDSDDSIVPELLTNLESQRKQWKADCQKEIVAVSR